MSLRVSILLFVVAALLGLAAAAGTKAYIARETAGFQVLIAQQDVPAGTALDGENIYELFRAISVPGKFSDMNTWVITPDKKEVIIGRSPSVDIPKDHLVTYSQFDPLGARREIFDQLKEGERAMSIAVGLTTSVANMLRPGDYVDVLAAIEDAQPAESPARDAMADSVAAQIAGDGEQEKLDTFSLDDSTAAKPAASRPAPDTGEGGTIVRTVLQRVLVLGVGERFNDVRNASSDGRRINYNTITVKVSADEAQKLLLAQALGAELTLTLRRADDEKETNTGVTGRGSLF